MDPTMRPLRGAAVFALLVASSLARAERAPARTDILQTRLSNGLTVVMQEDFRVPLVAASVRYHVGAADDPPSRRGLCLLTQYLMLEATKHVPKGGFERLLSQAGATGIISGVNMDYTRFGATVPKHQLELLVWLLSDQMGFFVERIDAKLIDEERRVIDNERRRRIDDEPLGSVAALVHDALLGSGHRYGGTYYGPTRSLEGVGAEEVAEFFDDHFGPENATLVLVGDFETPEVKELVEKYFGPIARGNWHEGARASSPTLTKERRIDIAARVSQPSLHVAWVVPGFFAADEAPLEILAQLLDGRVSARLSWSLVSGTKIASRVSAAVYRYKGLSFFEIAATAAPGHDTNELLQAIDDVLDGFQKSPASTDSISRANTEITRYRLSGWEGVGNRAEQIARYEQMISVGDYLKQDLKRYDAVKPADIARVIAKYLARDHRVVAAVTPAADAPVTGALRGRSSP
jgi:zinc protease